MKKIIYWSKPVVWWTIVAIASIQGTAIGQVQRIGVSPPNAIRTAQGDTAETFPGKCAIAREEIFAYNSPTTSGQRIRSLGPEEQVTLADEGRNGWIAIDSPIKGFVQIKDLKPCSPIGECRAAKQNIFVYDEPDSSGRKIRSILTDEEVIIAGTDDNGWIAISSPANGFVRAANLKICEGGDRAPESSTGKCRRVTDIIGEGLNIRTAPNTESDIIGSLFAGDIVRLTSDPPQINVDAAGRNWVEISFPERGWISEGFSDSEGRNLETATCPRRL